MPARSLPYRLVMTGDWHVGSGLEHPGLGVDAAVALDHEGFPFVPAKTLTGVWRDACELAASALDEGGDHSWARWVDALFGSQAGSDAALVSIRPARLPAGLRAALGPVGGVRTPLRQALTFVKPGVELDQRGVAREDHLRFVEMVRGGAELEGSVTLRDLDEDSESTAVALLWAGTGILERLGGNRRRGGGSCKLELKHPAWHDEDLLEVLSNGQPTAPRRPVPPTITSTRVKPKGDLRSFELRLTTLLPLVIPQRQIGNFVATKDYIPGSILLPVVARYVSRLGVDVGAVLGDHALQVGDALPSLDGAASVPVPRCFSIPKGEDASGGELINRMRTEWKEDKPLRQLRVGFMSDLLSDRGNRSPSYTAIATITRTHNTIDDEKQRPGDEGLYTYDAIPAGVELLSEVRLDRALVEFLDEEHPNWEADFQEELELGRSKKDDYGLVRASITRLPRSANRQVEPGAVACLLLSDCLIRDSHLRPSTNLHDFKEAVCSRLADADVTAEVDLVEVIEKVDRAEGKERTQSFATGVRRTESWQRTWNLPRPSLVGLSAGTCVLLDIDVSKGELSKGLRMIEEHGLGERIAEGFGRVRFNHPLLNNKKVTTRPLSTKRANAAALPTLATSTPATVSFARNVARQAWKDAIDAGARAIAIDEERRFKALGFRKEEGKSLPSSSQLGELAAAFSLLRSRREVGPVLRWLDHVAGSTARSKRWPAGSLVWLHRMLEEPDLVWDVLSLELDAVTLIVDDEVTLSRELWAEAVRAVVMACVEEHRRAVEASRSDEGS